MCIYDGRNSCICTHVPERETRINTYTCTHMFIYDGRDFYSTLSGRVCVHLMVETDVYVHMCLKETRT